MMLIQINSGQNTGDSYASILFCNHHHQLHPALHKLPENQGNGLENCGCGSCQKRG